uniref:SGNH hydrolase-type esterase domain-containing protein n=1 Tax=Tetradesmus obliquus TaxID=3088 RepID=A0A383VB09_TETOB|eukprot:jgi/Sobl393_1/17494/SZX62748.1
MRQSHHSGQLSPTADVPHSSLPCKPRYLLLLGLPALILLLLSNPPLLFAASRTRDTANSSSSKPAAALQKAATSSSSSSCPQGRVEPLQVPMANEQPPCLVRPVALLFGDSLTERSMDPDGGWGAALAHHFARKLDVVNRGCGGYNSRWGLKLLEQVLAQVASSGQQVALMTIWFGANDAAIPGRSAERQHVPEAEFGDNLAAMVRMARAAGIQRIVLLTPPPVGDDARVRHQQKRMGISTAVPPDRTLEYAGHYAAAARATAQALGLPLVDLYEQLQAVPGWRDSLFDDGLHFTPAGSRKVWTLLRDTLAGAYPELSLEALSNQFPWWDKWDAADPDAFWAAALPQMQAAAQQQQQQQERDKKEQEKQQKEKKQG